MTATWRFLQRCSMTRRSRFASTAAFALLLSVAVASSSERGRLRAVGAPASLAEASAKAGRVTLEDLVSIEPLGAPVLSPDGKQFAFVQNGQIALMPSDGGWLVPLTTTPGGKSGLAWSPDS